MKVNRGASCRMDHCCVFGAKVVAGPGEFTFTDTLTENPQFMWPGAWDTQGSDDPADYIWTMGDYRLQRGSPCIDAGALEGSPTVDIDGNGIPFH